MAAQFTNSTQEALQQAQAEAIRRENQEIQPEHQHQGRDRHDDTCWHPATLHFAAQPVAHGGTAHGLAIFKAEK